jgi:hypothetical protein
VEKTNPEKNRLRFVGKGKNWRKISKTNIFFNNKKDVNCSKIESSLNKPNENKDENIRKRRLIP